MGALMRSTDWSGTPLGPVASWPEPIRTAIALCLASRIPMGVFAGRDLTLLYNDALKAVLGRKHPDLFAKPGRACDPEIARALGPMLDGVMAAGEPAWAEAMPLPFTRSGYLEERYFTVDLSPVRLHDGEIGGVFCSLVEISASVIERRRTAALRDVTCSAASAATAEQVCGAIAGALARHGSDVPFALVYTIDSARSEARLAGAAGFSDASRVGPSPVNVQAEGAGASPWPLARAALTGAVVLVEEIPPTLCPLPAGDWPVPPSSALVYPITPKGRSGPAALLVAGISARSAFDDAYRAFYDLLAERAAASLAGAIADEDERERTVLRESEQLYRALVEQAGEGIWLTDFDGRILEANDSACRMLGYSREELIKLKISGLTHPEDIPARPVDLAALQVGMTLTSERRMRRKDGDYIHVEGTGRMLHEGRSLTITRDVTAQRQAESALRRSEQDFRAMFELAGVGKVQTDPAMGRFLRVNRKMCEITGYSADELIGMTARAITHPEDRAADSARFKRVLRGQTESWESEKRYIRKDGEVIWVHVSGTIVRDAAGRPLHTLAVILDITERKRLEAELTQRMFELAAADRQKDEFLAILAHELRNPLGPVLNAVQILGRIGPTDERSSRQRALITRQIRHMARLLDDLLDVSRITHGKIELRKVPLDLRVVVEQATESCRLLIDERGHSLSVSMPEQPLLVDADPTRMEQVIWNLLTNAAKYTPTGGHIELAAELCSGNAVVRVRDSGQGIPKEMLTKVFDLFTQVEQPSDRPQGGLGIGLTMVKKLLELHGGSAEARSEGLGRGSELVVSVPLLRTDVASASKGAPRARVSTPGSARVLVVDDNVDAALTLCDLLELWGYEHSVAHDGSAALETAQRFRPHIILLDIGLPVMDGYEVARRLRADPDLQGLKLFALTGYGQEQDRRRAIAAGFDHHLTKPVDPEVLETLLEGNGAASR